MKVFLSSTALDLKAYREVALDTIHRLEQQTVAMEHFGPSPETPVEECERRARECDVLICIVAHRYGFEPEKGRGSITRREVEAAYKAGKDVLVWIVADDYAWSEKKEQDLLVDPTVVSDPSRITQVAEAVSGLINFKAWLRQTFTTDKFTTPDDLGRKIAVALANYVGGKTAPPVAEDKISVSRLPTTSAQLFGREAELQLLDEAWANQNIHIVSFVAWGGVGKTALVNHWLRQRMARDNYRGADRVYAWSFFSQGTSERAGSSDLFIDQALRWFDDPDPTAGSPWDKGERVARYIRRKRTLLILDGLEPLQHPPGPQEGRLKDVALQALLIELAAQQPGLCVISTREKIGDLIEFENSTVIQHDLERLSPEAGAQVLRSFNVKGEVEELEAAAKELRGHAFSLTLLGSYLNEVLDGDIRRRTEVESLFVDTRYGAAAERMIAAYENWLGPSIELAIVRLLGLFDRPADLASIEALRRPPAIDGLTEAFQNFKSRDWTKAVEKLRRIKLVAEESDDPGALDSHPLVREYFKQQIKHNFPDAWRAANDRLYEHLKSTTKEFPDNVQEMSPLYAAVAHGCAAGRYMEALHDIYLQRIQRGRLHFNWIHLSAYGADLATLTNFFNVTWDEPVNEVLDDRALGFLLNEVGVDLFALGRLREALQPMQRGLQLQYENRSNRSKVSIRLNMTQAYLRLGELENALTLTKEAVSIADLVDSFTQVFSRSLLGATFHYLGRLDEATRVFEEAEALQKQEQPENPILFGIEGCLYCDLLLTKGLTHEVKQRAQEVLKRATFSDVPLHIALSNLLLGRGLLLEFNAGQAALSDAAEFVERGLQRLRGTEIVEIPYGLLTRAGLHRVTSKYELAERDLSEAYRIATRSDMRTYIADYHLESARLRVAQSDKEKAREHLTTAREMVDQMAYHRRDNQVRELEAQLG